MKKMIGALLTVVALVTATILVAPTAQAVTWTNQGLQTDTTYVDDCEGGVGAVRVELEWQASNEHKLRLNPNRDIKIVNNSDASIKIDAEDFVEGNGRPASIEYIRLSNNSVISAYTNTFFIEAWTTATVSVDNPARWARMDGVPDSDPSPYGTAIAASSNPAVAFRAQLYNTGGVCGWYNWMTEVANEYA